ncbi:TRAP transporter small permease subunit [Laspinema olomoucense]|uniref:TRAP transporter small permease subunit n=1 Tax=Laspinema olomoucense D3b TaxID=2953688 RepID=A0ABT2NAK5_9CYAN|nr:MULTISPECIES: TRAP transporter small permease subunit [unclassified Laspinema]MCT7979732.1 TRAP transporter small permease subunit [Laspinema sp. D3b]MCT7991775.1 TRAP transporter small permease subunit [Laspinema sp. D3a]
MDKLLRLSTLIDRLNEYIGRFLNWLVLLMVLVGVWNVIGRFLGRAVGQNLTSNALIETQWYIFDLIFLLGAAYALKHDEHVRVDVFYSSWSPKWKALLDLIGTLLFLIPFSILVIFFSWNTIASSWAIGEISPDPGGLPRYPIKTVILISFFLLILQGISEAIKKFAIFQGWLPPHEERHESEL